MIKIIIMTISILLMGYGIKQLLNRYTIENMTIVKKDEEEIVSQELKEVVEVLKESGEHNVLPEEEKDLGQVSQPQPEI